MKLPWEHAFGVRGTEGRSVSWLAMHRDLSDLADTETALSPRDFRRPKRIRLINASLERAWASGLATEPQIEAAAVIDKACSTLGADPDDLPGDWRARLELLAHNLQRDAALTPLGRTLAHGQLVSATSHMLRMRRLWERYPEIENQTLSRPIIVVGQMRSGTTRIQRLLACDPRLRFTCFYESWNPIPRGFSSFIPDDRRHKARVALAVAQFLNPDFRAIHPTGACEPDEEVGLFNILMVAAAYEVQWRVPNFVHHCEAMDTEPIYRQFRRMLKTVAWLRGTSDSRPWVLKVPQFAQDLKRVLAIFPDARIIHATRDVDAVVASSASLVCNQMSLQSEAVDPRWIGREWLRKVSLRDDRIAEALSETEAPRVELEYHKVGEDWAYQMMRVYEMIGLPFDAEVRARMARYVERSRKIRSRTHDYDLERFGLSPGMLLRAVDSRSATGRLG